MIATRKHQTPLFQEQRYELCIAALPEATSDGSRAGSFIDVGMLAWVYIEPQYQASEAGQQLLAWIAQVLGPSAWAMIQTSSEEERARYELAGFQIILGFDGQPDAPAPIGMYLSRTM